MKITNIKELMIDQALFSPDQSLTENEALEKIKAFRENIQYQFMYQAMTSDNLRQIKNQLNSLKKEVGKYFILEMEVDENLGIINFNVFTHPIITLQISVSALDNCSKL